MADREQRALLKNNQTHWSQWQEKHPQVTRDLTNADLSGANLHGANLSDADLSDADLYRAYLPHQAIHYKVVLHHKTDEITYVMFALYYAINTLPLHEAEQITLRAALLGQAVVMVCPKEQAECYWERLIHYHLTVTIEPDV